MGKEMNALRQARKRQGMRPAPKQATEKKGWFWWLEHIVMMATFVSICIGVWAFVIDYEDRKMAREAYKEQAVVNAETLRAYEEQAVVNAETLAEIEEARQDRQNDAITRALTLVTTPAVGNSGKVEALEYLYSQDIPLAGIDLSCATMGGEANWDAETFECKNGTYLLGINLDKDGDRSVNLYDAHLEGANLVSANLKGAMMWKVHLDGANLLGANLEGAYLSIATLEGANLQQAQLKNVILTYADLRDANFSFTNLEEADLRGANLEGAKLWANLKGADLGATNLKEVNFRGANLEDTNLSGANFTDARNLNDANFTGAWTWADRPPMNINLQTYGISLCVYKEGIHEREDKPDPCIPP